MLLRIWLKISISSVDGLTLWSQTLTWQGLTSRETTILIIYEDVRTLVTIWFKVQNVWPGRRFKNTYELLNLRALNFSPVNKVHIFQCMRKLFCVEFQRCPLKFHTKYLTHTLKDMFLYSTEISRALRFKSSYVFLKHPLSVLILWV